MNAMIARFQKSRWSSTRTAMEAMKPDDTITCPMSEYYNAHSSAGRLGDAYPERKWLVSTRGGKLTIQCKQNSQLPKPELP